MIDRHHDLSITGQAELLGMSLRSVYYLPRPISAADLALMRRIDELHLQHPFIGARMLRDQRACQGLPGGRRHIGTLILRMGIQSLAPQPGTSKDNPGHKIYPYLLRKLVVVRPNQVWARDTRRTSRWHEVSSTSPQSLTWTVATCCRIGWLSRRRRFTPRRGRR